MLRPNQVFQAIFVINLDRRPDRMAEFEAEAAANKIFCHRVSGVDGEDLDYPDHWNNSPGQIGCAWSHRKIWDIQIEFDLPQILVLEDDAQFVPGFGDKFEAFWRELEIYGGNWLMAYLGGNHRKFGAEPLIPISPRVGRTQRTLTTHAYALRIELARQLVKTAHIGSKPIDLHLADIQKTTNVFASIPDLAIQRPSHSDICGQHVDYADCWNVGG